MQTLTICYTEHKTCLFTQRIWWILKDQMTARSYVGDNPIASTLEKNFLPLDHYKQYQDVDISFVFAANSQQRIRIVKRYKSHEKSQF